MSTKQGNEVPAGLEVGAPPPSPYTSNPSARKPVPSYYAPPSSMQDGISQNPYSEDGRNTLASDGYSKPRRNPCDLSPLIYGLLVALITLIIIGAALGGGLGASLASAQRKNASASSTSSTTSSTTATSSSTTATTSSTSTSTTATSTQFSNYAVLRPTATSDTVALNCPGNDKKTYTTVRSQNFLMSCNVGLSGYDLVGIAAYTSDDCIEACSSMNAFNGTSVCTAITFNAAMEQNWYQHANCWLKTFEDITTSSGVGLLSAALQS